MIRNKYKLLEIIHETHKTVIHKAKNKLTDENVICKYPVKEYPSSFEIQYYKNEFNILNQIKLDGICKAIELEKMSSKPVLVIEFFRENPYLNCRIYLIFL